LKGGNDNESSSSDGEGENKRKKKKKAPPKISEHGDEIELSDMAADGAAAGPPPNGPGAGQPEGSSLV
jgi:hypothetical protein